MLLKLLDSTMGKVQQFAVGALHSLTSNADLKKLIEASGAYCNPLMRQQLGGWRRCISDHVDELS